jgi:hypothetical protein
VAKAPEGRLKVRTVNGKTRFYVYDNDRDRYLSLEDAPLIKALAQKSYDLDLLSHAKQELKILETTAAHYPAPIEQLYDELSELRQDLVKPFVKPAEQLLQEWYARPFKSKPVDDSVPVILTERGERVRSKSEKIIADYYHHHGILYKYECPLKLDTTIRGYSYEIHPDFTLFSKKRRTEIYHEHLGMMDKPSYYLSRMARLKNYEDNGYLIGERLLITFETEEFSLDIKNLEAKLKMML